MMVTDICKDEIIYSDTWGVKTADVEKNIKKYNESPKRFLFYPWGVFITALSRAHLWYGILEFGDDYIYSDTDSLKVINAEKHENFIRKYNNWCIKKADLMCKTLGLDPEDLRPKTEEGIKKPIGIFEKETEDHDNLTGKYLQFKALGAKRYLYSCWDYDKDSDTWYIGYHMTVAGVNKKVATPYLLKTYKDIFEAFKIGLHLPKGTTGKLTHVYIDELMSGELVDYMGNSYQFENEPPGIYLESAEYDFSISEDYYKFLKGVVYNK